MKWCRDSNYLFKYSLIPDLKLNNEVPEILFTKYIMLRFEHLFQDLLFILANGCLPRPVLILLRCYHNILIN